MDRRTFHSIPDQRIPMTAPLSWPLERLSAHIAATKKLIAERPTEMESIILAAVKITPEDQRPVVVGEMRKYGVSGQTLDAVIRVYPEADDRAAKVRALVDAYTNRPWPLRALGWATTGALAYHGYKRNGTVWGAVKWGVFGSWFWPITLPVALAQGFGKKAEK